MIETFRYDQKEHVRGLESEEKNIYEKKYHHAVAVIAGILAAVAIISILAQTPVPI